jgi:hypothetical protein
LAVQKVTESGSGYSITIKNIGGYPAPVDIVAMYTDGSTETFHQTPAIWSSNQKEATVHIDAKKKIKSFTLQGGIFMDADESNNTWSR